jgi:hypothetical protein
MGRVVAAAAAVASPPDDRWAAMRCNKGAGVTCDQIVHSLRAAPLCPTRSDGRVVDGQGRAGQGREREVRRACVAYSCGVREGTCTWGVYRCWLVRGVRGLTMRCYFAPAWSVRGCVV